ncbi:MAG: AI-2E family transporter [Pontiella sp.]
MTFSDYLKRILATVLLLIFLYALWSTRSILVLAFAAVVIAIAIAQPMHFLQRRGMKRGLAATLSILFSFMLVTLLSLWVVPTLGKGVADLVQDVPAAVEIAKQAYEQFCENKPVIQSLLPRIPSANFQEAIDAEALKDTFNWLVKSGMAIAPDLLGGIGLITSILVHLGLVLFISIFFLIDPHSYLTAVLYLIPAHNHKRFKEVFNILGATLTKWLNAQLFSVTVIVLLVYILLGVILQMPNAMVVALFAGFATFIPNIGAVLPLIPITIFTLAYSEPSKLLLYLPVYLAIQFLESNIITPQVVKAQLNIPAGYLMLFQLLIIMALGALGLVLAVPILACLIVFVREVYSFDVLKLKNISVQIDD